MLSRRTKTPYIEGYTVRGPGHPVRNTIIGVVVLLVLFTVGGIAYTYYIGNSYVEPPKQEVKVASNKELPKPWIPDPNAKESASVTTLLTPVAPGENTSITIKTNPTSKCVIVMEYGTLASKDSGLKAKVADQYGTVSWTWTVEPEAPLGKWPVKVTCVFNGRSAFVQGDLELKKAPPAPLPATVAN